jgi:hypothetical protein
MYLAICTRPDIAFIVQVLSRYLQCAGEEHLRAAKRVYRYLKGTRSFGTTYSAAGARAVELSWTYARDVLGFSDADWTGDKKGYLFKLARGSISWASKLQASVSLSSTEAECVAAAAETRGFIQEGPTAIIVT